MQPGEDGSINELQETSICLDQLPTRYGMVEAHPHRLSTLFSVSDLNIAEINGADRQKEITLPLHWAVRNGQNFLLEVKVIGIQN